MDATPVLRQNIAAGQTVSPSSRLNQNRMNRPILRILVGVSVAVFLLAGGTGAFVWIKIAGLKARVEKGLENALGAKVEIASLNVDAWNERIEASGISLANQRPGAPWDKGEIGQAVATFKWRDLFGPTIPLDVEVSSWKVTLHSSSSGVVSPNPENLPEADTNSVPTRNAIQVKQIAAHDGEVEIDLAGDKKILIHQTAFEAKDDGTGTWTTELKAGSVVAGTIQTGAGAVQIQGTQDKITFSGLHLQCDQGAIEGGGQISLTADHSVQAALTAAKVPVAMLVAVQWQMKLSGLASGSVDYHGNDQSAIAHGHLDIAQARINVLPILSKVTSLVSLPDLAGVDLDRATADFDWKDRILHLTNLDLRKTDLARISGEVQIDPMGQVDGNLKLGLPSTTTAKWPDLQTKVFSVPFEDYNWTEVHVTGTSDHLQEDLSPRLLTVGLNDSGNLLNSAAQKAFDLFNNVLKPTPH